MNALNLTNYLFIGNTMKEEWLVLIYYVIVVGNILKEKLIVKRELRTLLG